MAAGAHSLAHGEPKEAAASMGHPDKPESVSYRRVRLREKAGLNPRTGAGSELVFGELARHGQEQLPVSARHTFEELNQALG